MSKKKYEKGTENDCFFTFARGLLQQMQREKAIQEILNTHSSSLANKELQFLTNIRDKRHLTPRQQSYLNSLGRRCLGVNICLVEHNHNA